MLFEGIRKGFHLWQLLKPQQASDEGLEHLHPRTRGPTVYVYYSLLDGGFYMDNRGNARTGSRSREAHRARDCWP